MTLKLDPGPDPSMRVALFPVGSSDDAVQQAVDVALRSFAGPPNAAVREVAVDPKKGASVELRVPRSGTFALATQHLPEEFALRLLERGGRALAPVASRPFAASHTHDKTVTSVGIHSEGALDEKRLNEWLAKLLREQGTDIFRMKGILNIAGQEQRFVFQGVHMLFDGRPDRAWGTDPRANDLVFIGRNLDRAALEKGFRRCLR